MAGQITVNDAAKELGVSPGRVRILIGSGRLKAEKIGTQYLLKPKDLDAVRVRKVGRPATKATVSKK